MAPTLFSMKKCFPIAILFSVILFELVPSAAGAGGACTLVNRTDDAYNHNLLNLLNTLTLSASTSKFQNITAGGGGKGAAYGQYLCRGDTTLELCHSCVTRLANWIITDMSQDTDCWNGAAYSDQCNLQYANSSFFGMYDDNILGSDHPDASATEFRRSLAGMFEDLISDAAESSGLFATREAVGRGKKKVYGLAQCNPDIGRSNCTRCLTKASSTLQSWYGDKTSGWILLASCQLWYDNSTLFASSGYDDALAAYSNAQPVSGGALLLVTLAFSLFRIFI